MIILILIGIFSVATFYNLLKYIEIKSKANLIIADYISFAIVIILIAFLFIKVLNNNIYNYILAIVFLLYTISGVISKGYDKSGVYNNGHITFLVKYTKWRELKEIKLEYNKDGFVDVFFATDTRAFRHRYKEEQEKVFLRLKRDLKI